MSNKLQKYIINNNKNKTFTNKTFTDFRKDLLKYANEFYSENIIDFSETSLGGLFLDFAAIVGDSLVYYAEQQFSEMNIETATDPETISRFLKNSGIRNIKASPSSAELTITLTITSSSKNINKSQLPIIRKNSEFSASNGTGFILDEDVNFQEDYIVNNIIENDPSSFNITISKKGTCSSGKIGNEYANFSGEKQKFLKYELENTEITKIISVYDNENNQYYEVESLSQDYVFSKVTKFDSYKDDSIIIKACPYRYMLEEDYDRGTTILRFGNGDNTHFDQNLIPDPLSLLLPLKNKEYVSNLSVSPSSILSTNMLGISPAGKNIKIEYKYGGGSAHNVSANSINNIENLIVSFTDNSVSQTYKDNITDSIIVNNEEKAVGGSNPPSFEQIKEYIKLSNNTQSRIVTHEDLLTRLFLMPTDFGKIYKAAAFSNENSSGIKDIFILCKDKDGYLENSNDALKLNISRYINENRLIGDNFNIFDTAIFNFGIEVNIKINKGFDAAIAKYNIKNDINTYMRFDSFEIGQGIDVNKLVKIIHSNPGVASIVTNFNNIIYSKSSADNFLNTEESVLYEYNNNRFNSTLLFKEGIILPPHGGIFELKYPNADININVSA